jgi:heterodisulfide reductase subunit A
VLKCQAFYPIAFGIPRSMVQAVGLQNRGPIEIEPMTAEVLPLRCVACGLCVDVCPAGAVKLVEVRGHRQAEINPAPCKGCGLCMIGFRGGATMLYGFTDRRLAGCFDRWRWYLAAKCR